MRDFRNRLYGIQPEEEFLSLREQAALQAIGTSAPADADADVDGDHAYFVMNDPLLNPSASPTRFVVLCRCCVLFLCNEQRNGRAFLMESSRRCLGIPLLYKPVSVFLFDLFEMLIGG